ncbi:MAG TPA: carboxypeptidase regulatory-like domain-containing protein [Pirellulales bacterium]|nr:carboxypeptidase regulatory-like domain-containing protein [Pirellulales bacterium]
MRGLVALGLVIGLAALGGALRWYTTRSPPSTPAPRIVGRVVESRQPIAGARVRLKGTADFALTDEQGRFELIGSPREGATLTAAKDGYLIAGVPVSHNRLEVQLTALPARDHTDYQWVDPRPSDASAGACGNCHQAIYNEWQTSGHARSAVNRRFQNLLDGSNERGESGHGWGLADEYPEGVAVCWSCHAPSFELSAATAGPRHVEGVAAAGVHCDFCHKIRATNLEQVGLTHGRFAYDLLRPAEGQLFFGPLDDVDRNEDAYSALQSESRFCAACHEGTLFGVHVYTTYSEWLASPAGREGRQCQQCHMRPSGKLANIAPGSGGLDRNPQTLASHTFLPGGREAMLRQALRISFSAQRQNEEVTASVRLETHDIGHRLPTGFIDRQLLLVVEPLDAQGKACDTLSGARLPDAAGERLLGKAGRLFAKLLTDAEGNAPAPFWRAGVSVADSRLTPGEPEETAFAFPSETVTVRVRVIYRPFWQTVADSKEWPENDTVIYDTSFSV